MGVDPQRFREQLVRGIGDDGLEELTLRLARTEHDTAHRTGRGRDDGIDVLSDYESPPARGWQAKTSSRGTADWTKCRASLEAAMKNMSSPRRYTLVFSHPLSEPQRRYWRDHFLPEESARYPDLEVLDHWDDLASRVEQHPEIVDWLADGALGVYVRRTLELTKISGVNPLAGAVDLAEGARSVAEHARRIGRTDPRFSYGVTGRDAHAGDAVLPDRVARFTMSAGQRDALPRFSLTIRDGDMVKEVTAAPQPGVDVVAPKPWFADTPGGERARAEARSSLARGRAIRLEGAHVGVVGGDVPDRFRDWTAAPGSQSGTLELGVSEPLELTITLTLPGFGPISERLAAYCVPPLPGADFAYAGAMGGAVLGIDVREANGTSDDQVAGGGRWMECSLAITLAVQDEPIRQVLSGLGFARAFGEADRLHFDCPGLLPASGYDIDGPVPMEPQAEEAWEVAATVAAALDVLQQHDGRQRRMPEAVGPGDLTRAQTVLELFQGGEVRLEASGEFLIVLPPTATPEDDPVSWRCIRADLPPIAGQPIGLRVEQTVEGAEPVGIVPTRRGTLALAYRAGKDGARIVMRAI